MEISKMKIFVFIYIQGTKGREGENGEPGSPGSKVSKRK